MKKAGKVVRKIILVVAFSLIGLITFYILKPGKAITLVFPDLHKISYVNAVIKNDSAFTTISLLLENKNSYKLDIDTVSFEVKLNDTGISKQVVPLNIKQSRFEEDTIQLPINLHIKQIKSLITNLQGKDSTNVNVKGYIIYQTFFGRKKIEFNKTTKIEVPIPPKIKIIKVQRNGFSLKDKILKANAIIEIINNGKNIYVELTDIHYNITVKNTLHTNGIISKPVTIKPGSSLRINLPIEIKIYHPLKTIWLIKTDQDRLNYSLQIKCNLKENISQKSFVSPAEITSTGMLELVK
ncbi:MAG: LEA type 2 family protein [Bacteroidia bacterium]|nr:LEA type 2 family protein [Bacteroidia bacterium]